MKKYCLLIIIFVFSLATATAQENRREVIAAQKVAYFTRQLSLSPQEARLFWPVYDEFTAKRDKIVEQRNTITRNVGKNFRNMSEKELEEAGDELIRLNLQEAELKAEYHNKFKEVLTPSKVVRLYHAENGFKNYLLNQLRSRRENMQANQRRKFQ
ncbi:MAG TPA: hypothetical protein DEQ09_11350 [Bacteroidales bacterium]|nr:hypothetical protein [Bacteroidales bacterium]